MPLIGCLIYALSGLAHADEVDDFIRAEMTKRKIPGLQLAVVRDNKIIKVASYGLANIEDAVAVEDDTLFSINSITKAFAGVAVMQLVEQGKLDISASISTYLPDLPVAWQGLNIKQLMSHTSGLPAILAPSDTVRLISDEGADASWALVQTLPNEFAVGSEYKYNQTNYVLIGRIIERVSGQSFADFINENQLQKVGMKRTEEAGFSNLNNVIPHSARRYTYYYGEELANIKAADFPPLLYPAAGMSSTAVEIASWLIALQTGKLLEESSSIETLWTPAVLDNGQTQGFNDLLNGYALGWPVVVRDEHPALGPEGGDRAAFFVYPQDGMSIVVVTNLMGAVPSQFIDDVAGVYIPEMRRENGFGLSPALKILWRELEAKGYDKAMDVAQSLQATRDIQFAEADINRWGYSLVAQEKLQPALNVFLLNTHMFPDSANTYDSLAETHWRLGNIDAAIIGYEKVLKMQPDNEYAQRQLAKLKSVTNE
jgi:CubicO group peptidase (beta-lactamase class C family)